MFILKILGFLLLAVGVIVVFMSKQFVLRFKLKEKTKVGFEHEMSEEEVEQFKENKAIVSVKMLGMLIALPGFIFILIAFK